ncbi:thiamine pyrophosphate-binding protein [Shewanella salipaludis]|nr:thiamine pyrophosphate-binding protein [Shewanella salipaludis]
MAKSSEDLHSSSTLDMDNQSRTQAQVPVSRIDELTPQLDLADLLLHYLSLLQIDFVFGIPGGAIEPMYNALARSERQAGPRAIIARHETGAVFMADGYASRTGKLGVCCATTGPGTTNLITGVASAYANQIPLLIITAQTPLSSFGKGAFQESSCTGINTVAMFEYCTRYNTLISHPEQFERKLAAALMKAFASPPGPVHLSIPLDVFRSPAPIRNEIFDIKRLLHKKSLLDREDLDALFKELQPGKNTVFVIGEGASEAIGAILTTAHMLDAILLTTPHGKGLISPYHPQFRGVVGFAGHQNAVNSLRNEQLENIVCIGTALSEWASNGWDSELLLNPRLIHIDEQEANFTYTPMAKLHIRGRILTIFEQLYKKLTQSHGVPHLPHPEPSTRERHFMLDNEAAFMDTSKPIKPQRLMHDLAELFPPHTRYLADTGASFAWAIHYLHPYDRRMVGNRDARGGLFRACLEFASMGWAIGCAVGVALAAPAQPVVCITGDGSMLMSGQELTVAVQHGLPVIFVVLNDSALGMVKQGQKLSHAEAIGTALPQVDFAAMAAAMGAANYRIETSEDLHKLPIEQICRRKGPTLLDVYIDVDEVAPIGARIKQLSRVDKPANQGDDGEASDQPKELK